MFQHWYRHWGGYARAEETAELKAQKHPALAGKFGLLWLAVHLLLVGALETMVHRSTLQKRCSAQIEDLRRLDATWRLQRS
jgi:hypothetical protein